ncbi:MAG: cation-translocating P-type ATPase [Coriobacteriales bacterium]|nr:cation-translocating P-type ATPase [Coriobacteriales bacterium]
MKPYLLESSAVLNEQGTDEERGLAGVEAQARLDKFGPNKLDEGEKTPMWKRFFAQMADPMIIMLIVAAVVSAVVGIYEGGNEGWADVGIILFVVILNSVLGVVQESKAEEALEALQEMAAAQSKVVRDGRIVTVPSSELVPGDIVVLEAGDSVPADCRILECASMKVEEAALTGESVAVEKKAKALSIPAGEDDIPLGDRRNMCYMGSVVVYGRGKAVVVGTGMDTEMGKIADALAKAEDEQTPLQIKLAELSRILTILVVAISAFIILLGMLKNGGVAFFSDIPLVLDTFMTAVSLAVAAIPEGLAAVVTIVLSIGVTKMSRHNAIIRKLTAVETLGCTQLICSDKTGTLTQNKMTVVRHEGEDMDALVRTMALCSDAKWDDVAQQAVGEPTEAALVADAAKVGFTTRDLEASRPRIGEAPFDSGRKMMSVVVRTRSGKIVQHTKGGPDVILSRCTRVLRKNEIVPMTDEIRAEIMEANKEMADQALRVLAAARRTWDAEPESYDPDYLEQDLIFVGLSGMIDPVRPEVKDAIAEAHSAGIRVVMITGDHIDTAVAIAKELGIVESRDQAITGAELDRISDEELATRIEEFGVYARVQPEHKVRIVDAWKKKDKIVAMTGDGVNDAPSIKKADIGVGMGITGTDVTKNVADMVLADDNFATIVAAVEEGRKIYDNIRKCIQFLLSSNLAEVISVFVASMIGFTILEPAHLLWINLITDSLPALAMSMEEAEPGVMKRPPRDSREGIFAGGMGIDCIFQGIVISILTLVSFYLGTVAEYAGFDFGQLVSMLKDNPEMAHEGMTMAFLTLSMVEMFHSFNMRSRRQSIFTLKGQNWWLWGAFLVAFLLTFLVIEIPFLADMFSFTVLDLKHYGMALGLAILIIPIMEVYKAVMRAIEKSKS